MLIEDFIITVFVCVDDILKNLTQGKRLRKRGPDPKLKDSEVIAMEIVGEFLGIDTDKGIVRYFKNHWQKMFPELKDRSLFIKQSSNLWKIKQAIREELIEQLVNKDDEIQIIDGLPMPVCGFRRANFSKGFKNEAEYGHCASKNQTYYGFKGHVLIDRDGTIIDFLVTAANVDERDAALSLSHLMKKNVLGDKGYLMKLDKVNEFKSLGIDFHTPVRSNMRDDRCSKFVKWMNKTRRFVETVIGQLSERFNIEKIWARDTWHLTNRINRKLLAHTICQFIARKQGISGLQFDKLITV